MNKSRLIVLGIIALWLCFLPCAQAVSGSAPVEFQYMLESQTASTNRSKPSWLWFVTPCSGKDRAYKRLVTDWGSSGSYYNDDYKGGADGGNHQLRAHQEQYLGLDSNTVYCTNWSGSFTNFTWRGVGENYYSWSDTATLIYCDQWSGVTNIGNPCSPYTHTETNALPTIAMTNSCFNSSGDESATNFSTVTNWTVLNYANEYTTEELFATNDFNYPNGDWLAQSPSPHAFTSIWNSEREVAVQKLRYRFKVIAPLNAHFEFDYYVHFLADGSTNEIVTTNTITGIGTGSWAYYGPVEITAPRTNAVVNGCTNLIGAQQWIELQCGGSDTPCSAGRCSSSPGSFSVGNQGYGIDIRANLGRDSFGRGSGSLVIAGASPQPNLVKPAGLEFFGSLAGVERLRNQDGTLRQARAEQLLANIVVISGSSYRIECFSPSQVGAKDQDGWYTTSGSPLSTATIAQGSSTNQILVTVVNGTTTTYDYTWSLTDLGWTLTAGGGLRRETRTWNPSTLVSTNTIKDSANQIVYQEVQYYQNLASWGNVMTKRVVGPQGPALTTQWFYFDNAQTNGVNYGKVKLAIQPSGAWTSYQYATNGFIIKEVSQFLNAPTNAADNQCRVVLHDYTAVVTNCSCELRTELLLGQEISRQYILNYGSEIRTIQCQTPGNTNLNAADNLLTVTRYYYDGSFVGRLKSITNPDGSVQLYSYEANGTQMTTTVLSGQPDATGTSILDGTETVTTTGQAGELESSAVTDFASTIMTAYDNYTYNDDQYRSYTVSHYDNTQESVQYACCGIDNTTDRDGTVTQYSYDALKRQTASTRNGITTSNVLDAAGNVLATILIGTDASKITLHQATYDVAGRLSSETNALLGPTFYTNVFDASGQPVKTNTYPDGGTRIEAYYKDGSLQSISGTAAFSVRYEYGVESEGGVQRAYAKEIKRDASGTDTGEWIKSYTDMLGRNYKTLYADNASSRSYYNSQGQLAKQVDPDGVTTLYQYNPKGEMEYTAIHMNTNTSVIDFAGADRITRRVSDVCLDNDLSTYVTRTRTFVWATSNLDNTLCLSTNEVSTISQHTWTTDSGLATETITTYPGSGQRVTRTYAPDRSYTVTTWQSGQLASVVRYDSNGTQLSAVNYGYDAHGRQNQVTDARNGTTTYTYNAAGLVQSLTTPAPAAGQPAQTTTTYYNKMLQVTNVVQPDNTSVFTDYFPTGLQKKQYGARQYPVEYTYDYAGRMKTMKTWSNYAGNQGATNTWNYDSARGWLTNKVYDGGAAGPSYGYTPAGRLKTRLWARTVTTTNAYNSAGDLSAVTYSDTTPAVGYGYDRRGRQTTVTLPATTTSRTFDDAGNLLSEAYSGGLLGGLSVTNGFDQYLRRTALRPRNQQTNLSVINYAYDSASRLYTVTDNTTATPYSATYSYIDNSPLSGQIDFAANGVNVMSTIKQYDYLSRLTAISTVNPQSATISSFSYSYNNANQRTNATVADNSRWVYTYDSLGQVISGRKYWPDGTAVAGQQFDYSFDDIGNRTWTTNNSRPAHYVANTLNQYTSRDVPGFLNSLGSASSNATVSLWTDNAVYATTSRKGDYFRGELSVNNSTGALWLTITNVAVLSNGTNADILATSAGKTFLPKSTEQF